VVLLVFFSPFSVSAESTNPFGKIFGGMKKVEKSIGGSFGNGVKKQGSGSRDSSAKADKPNADRKKLSAGAGSPRINANTNMRGLGIVGIKLGMTVLEAEAAIKKHNGEFKIIKRFNKLREVPDTDFVSNLVGHFGPLNGAKGTEVILVSFLRPPDSPVVGMIQRTLTFEMSEAPTLENTKTSLFEKYGKPNDASNMRKNEYQWAFYENGESIQVLKDSRVCKVRVKGLNISSTVKDKRTMLRARPQNRRNIKCGLSIGAKIREGSGLAYWISIELLDYKMLYEETKNTQEFVQSYREEKKNAKLESATKKSKPKF